MTLAEPATVEILVVEDEAAIRRVARRALSGAGYQVVEAEDGEHALKVAAQHPAVALLFTDVAMPNLGGVELARQLCAARPELKVLYASGYAHGKVDILEDLDADAAFLAKPYSLEALLKAVRGLLFG